MAIPTGSTAKALTVLARWLLVVVIVAGMLNWWLPGYRIWGALVVGVLAVWTLWLCRGIVSGDRKSSWQPAYLALVAPALVLIYHASRNGLGAGQQSPCGLAGALNMSLLFQFWLLATGVLICQELLSAMPQAALVLSICGAAMMSGPVMAMRFGQASEPMSSLALVAYAGAAVWVAPLWCGNAHGSARPHALASRPLRMAVIGVAAAACATLAVLAPLQAVVSVAVVAAALILAGLTGAPSRTIVLAVGAGLAVLAGVALAVWPAWPEIPLAASGMLGRGEQAFADLPATQTGVAVLASTTGWLGLSWTIAVAVISLGFLLARRSGAPARGRHIVWTIAAALSGCSLLAGGGMSIPSVTLAVCFTWGLLPSMAGWNPRRVSGLFVAVAMVALILLLGLSRLGGLISWVTGALGGSDAEMHIFAGFFTALAACWLAGARKLVWGLLAAVVAALAGAGGELLQEALSDRIASWSDWIAHLEGCAGGAALYLLCMSARWCESPDAVATRKAGGPPLDKHV